MQDTNPEDGTGGPASTPPPTPTPTPTPAAAPPGATARAWASHSTPQRAIAILTRPAEEWVRIDDEATTTGRLFTGYAMILALIPPLAILVAMLLSGIPLEILLRFALPFAVIIYLVSLGIAFALGLAIDALAPSFGGTRNPVQAMKASVYSFTPLWVFGTILLLLFTGMSELGWLWLIVGFVYGAYLLWLGLPRLMRVAPDRAAAYVGATVVIWAVLMVIGRWLAIRLLFEILGVPIFYY